VVEIAGHGRGFRPRRGNDADAGVHAGRAVAAGLAAGAYRRAAGIAARCLGKDSRLARDLALARAARRAGAPEIVWPDGTEEEPGSAPSLPAPLRAAE